jgi:hypothetical protein
MADRVPAAGLKRQVYFHFGKENPTGESGSLLSIN